MVRLRCAGPVLFGALLLAACSGDEGSSTPANDAGLDGSGDTTRPTDGSTDSSGPTDLTPEEERAAILEVPETETWTLPGLTSEVYVLRTEADIPHIYAANRLDMHRVQGFTLARDRYFQFELARRLAQGNLSELLGELGLSIDQQSVGQGMRFVADQLWDRLTDSQRADFEAFAEGINGYIRAAKAGTLPGPSELVTVGPMLGAENPNDLMQEVDGRDVASFGSFVIFQLGYESSDLLRESIWQAAETMYTGEEPLAELRAAGVLTDIIERVAPVANVSSANGFGLDTAGQQKAGRAFGASGIPVAPSAAAALRLDPARIDRLVRRHNRSQALFRREAGGEYGSNTWAAGPQLTGGNGTLLAGDGHLGLGVAPFFYQMGRHLTPFGDGSIQEVGLYFPGLPMMGVGTNGRVAWSQTYLYGDITDFYGLPVELGEDGRPARWGTESAPLIAFNEEYTIAPVLGAEGRTETWQRWETESGLWLADIEGTLIDSVEDAGDQTVVTMQGDLIIPGDTDGDGEITGIFFDYVAFELGDTIGAVERFAQADNVEEFREATRGLVGYAGNFVAADREGNILYTSYNATPCRLPLGGPPFSQPWDSSRDPRRVITGDDTGFTVPLTEAGLIDDTTGDDPVTCMVPFDEWPVALNPERGYVANANNDPTGATFDNNMFNDPWYVGYGFSTGYRADTIEQQLAAYAESGDADLASMSALQGEIRSRTGEDFLPALLEAVAAMKAATGADPLAEIYNSNRSGLDEAATRLQAWADAGYRAESGVETFYNTVDDQERADAVATMIFNQWLKEVVRLALGDEPIELAFANSPNENRLRTLLLMLDSRGAAGADLMASWNPETQESAYWDVLGTLDIESSTEVLVQALANALTVLSGDGRADVGGFETTDMDAWLWGLRHQVRFRSVLVDFAGDNAVVDLVAGDFAINTGVLPLAPNLSQDDPREGLTWFPRHGDLFAVDAPNYSLLANDFFYSSGPVMRMVIALTADSVEGVNILPGGQSGRIESEHFADQCSLWLGNQTVPMRLTTEDVLEGAVGRETFRAE